MNGKTRHFSLANAKGLIGKAKGIMTKKWFIALLLAMTVCCGLAAMLYLPVITLSYDQLKLGVTFSGFVAAVKIIVSFGIVFLISSLPALEIAAVVVFVSKFLFGGNKLSPETIFKTAALSATMIILVFLLSMGRHSSLTEEISESYSFSKNQLVEKMLVAHKNDVRRKHKGEVDLEVPKIGLASGVDSKLVQKEFRDKVVLMYAEKGYFDGEERVDITTAVVKKSNFSYKKSKNVSVKKEGFVWKNDKFKRAFNQYLDDSTREKVFDLESDVYSVTAPTGFGTNLIISPEDLEKLSVNENNNEQNGGI